MKILLTGATGFIGAALTKSLSEKGHELIVLSRSQAKVPSVESLRSVEAVIHLAGEPIAGGRWTAEKMARIRDSRVLGTRSLLEMLVSAGARPGVFVSSSAVGYYGDRGDEILDESSGAGHDFLAGVCQEWERESILAHYEPLASTRRVALRTGMVLARKTETNGGALEKLLPIYRAGLGGPIGDGRQWMSWIHRDDLISLFLQTLVDDSYRGAVNAVSPEPVIQRDFARELGSVLHRPAFLPTPKFAVRLSLGKMSEVVLASQRVHPKMAIASGFDFRYPSLRSALQESVGR